MQPEPSVWCASQGPCAAAGWLISFVAQFFTWETPIPDVTLAGQGSEDGPDQASLGSSWPGREVGWVGEEGSLAA